MRRRSWVMLVSCGLLAFGVVACNNGDTVIQTGGIPQGISVRGVGIASGAPDIVRLSLGVQVERPTVEEAREEAATSQKAVIDSLRANGIQEKDISTQQFSIQAQYEDAGRRLRGYLVTNLLVVEIRNLSTTSKVIDATRAGGNSTVVRGISFTIDDPDELEAQARELAIQEARRRAEEIARHSGARVGRLVSISEYTSKGGPETISAPRTGAAQADTPIQPGELDVVVNVSAVYAIE